MFYTLKETDQFGTSDKKENRVVILQSKNTVERADFKGNISRCTINDPFNHWDLSCPSKDNKANLNET